MDTSHGVCLSMYKREASESRVIRMSANGDRDEVELELDRVLGPEQGMVVDKVL